MYTPVVIGLETCSIDFSISTSLRSIPHCSYCRNIPSRPFKYKYPPLYIARYSSLQLS